MTVAPFPKRSRQLKTTGVLKLIHANVMGPMNTPSSGGARYILLFVDVNLRYVSGFFLKKSEVASKFGEYKALLETRTGQRIKKVRINNRSEFVNKSFDGICVASGIAHQLAIPYSPQQNGLVERMN